MSKGKSQLALALAANHNVMVGCLTDQVSWVNVTLLQALGLWTSVRSASSIRALSKGALLRLECLYHSYLFQPTVEAGKEVSLPNRIKRHQNVALVPKEHELRQSRRVAWEVVQELF